MHKDICAWVGKCLIHTQPEAEKPHEHPWNVQCYAAVWTETYEGFSQAVRNHCQAQGHYLVWAEQVYPILLWLNRYGHHNTMIDLAKTVDGNHSIALSPLVPRSEAGKPLPAPTYLEVIEQTIPPLPDQSDKPFWEKDWIVPELKDLLFGQPDTQQPLHTYLIVDATLRTRISGIFDLHLQDVPIRSLVRPEMAENLRDVAPYLVDMTLPEGAWGDRKQVPGFHIDFFANHWCQSTGILIRTTANMDAVWAHFHHFVRVQAEETQEWLFFRYWDPDITSVYFDKIKDTPEKIAQWFYINSKTPISSYIINDSSLDCTWHVSPKSNLTEIVKNKELVLSQSDMAAFRKHQLEKYKKRLCVYFSEEDSFHVYAIGTDNLKKVISLGIKKAGTYGLTQEESVRLYIHLMLFLGSHYDKDPMLPWARKILFLKHHPDGQVGKVNFLREEFIEYVKQTCGTNGEYLKSFMAICQEKLTNMQYNKNIQSVFDFISDNYPEKYQYAGKELLHQLIRHTEKYCEKHGLKEGKSVLSLSCMRFVYGTEVLNDPLFPWIQDACTKKESEINKDELLQRLIARFIRKVDENIKEMN